MFTVMHAMADDHRNAFNRHISDIAANVRGATRDNGANPLGIGFQPGRFDVICTRPKVKAEKSAIVSSIVDSVRAATPSGGFVREEDGQWYEVGEQAAREKVTAIFREFLHDRYKSSTKAKKRQRYGSKSEKPVHQESQNSETFSRSLSSSTLNDYDGSDYSVGSGKQESSGKQFESQITSSDTAMQPQSCLPLYLRSNRNYKAGDNMVAKTATNPDDMLSTMVDCGRDVAALSMEYFFDDDSNASFNLLDDEMLDSVRNIPDILPDIDSESDASDKKPKAI